MASIFESQALALLMGVVEWKHLHIIEKVHAFLLDTNLLGQLWVDPTTYVINRLLTSLLDNHSPFEKLFYKVPEYSFFACV